jgi:hypothetical protein
MPGHLPETSPDGYETGKTYWVQPLYGAGYMAEIIDSYIVDVMRAGNPTRYYKVAVAGSSNTRTTNECVSKIWSI